MTNAQSRVETITVKVSPEFKSLIKEEMATKGKNSLSSYVLQIIERRHDATEDVAELKRRILHLEAENSEFRRQADYALPCRAAEPVARIQELELQVRAEKQQRFELQKELTQTRNERATLAKIQGTQLPFWLDNTGYIQLMESLKNLRQKFPKHEFQTLLLKALHLVARNERSFTMLRMKHILSSNSKKSNNHVTTR